MRRRDVLRGAAGGLTVTAGLVGATASVAAERGAIYDLFQSDAEAGSFSGLDKTFAALRGGWTRVFAEETDDSAKALADATADVFNSNSETLVEYANEQLATSRTKTGIDTIRVTFEKTDDEAKRYIVADVDDNNDFTAASMTASTDRDVDAWVRLEKLAADNAADELERFVDEYASENRAVDPKLEGRLAGTYGPDVESSLL